MIEISVVMSVYNETQEELSRAIESILMQSFKEFEFIIILDNPKNTLLRDILIRYQQSDSRIRVYVNSQNIGLAMSLNKAIRKSCGRYIARMDADDISLHKRLESEYKAIIEKDVDVVSCNYIIVNSEGQKISFVKRNYSNSDIVNILPYVNIIAHPTVMFKRSLFNEVGGYREFPCAQDYDLWLRMMSYGARFYIVQDFLFKYTIRDSAISQKNRIKQFETSRYIKMLFKERKLKGRDSFSLETYHDYLLDNRVFDEKYIENYEKWCSYKKYGKNIITYIFSRIILFVFCDFYRKYFAIVALEILIRKVDTIIRSIGEKLIRRL